MFILKILAIICVVDMHKQTVENYFKTFIFGSIDHRSHDTGSAGPMVRSFDFQSSNNSSLFTLSYNRYKMGTKVRIKLVISV